MIAEWVRYNGKCSECGDYPIPSWSGIAYSNDDHELIAFFCRKPECRDAGTRLWEERPR